MFLLSRCFGLRNLIKKKSRNEMSFEIYLMWNVIRGNKTWRDDWLHFFHLFENRIQLSYCIAIILDIKLNWRSLIFLIDLNRFWQAMNSKYLLLKKENTKQQPKVLHICYANFLYLFLTFTHNIQFTWDILVNHKEVFLTISLTANIYM